MEYTITTNTDNTYNLKIESDVTGENYTNIKINMLINLLISKLLPKKD